MTAADETFLRSMRGRATVLGVAVQLCTLPWLDVVPDEVSAAPPAAVERLADRLGVAAEELAGYGGRAGHAQLRVDREQPVQLDAAGRGEQVHDPVVEVSRSARARAEVTRSSRA